MLLLIGKPCMSHTVGIVGTSSQSVGNEDVTDENYLRIVHSGPTRRRQRKTERHVEMFRLTAAPTIY